ncbi:MAG: hypothetical protein GY824_21085, partial [Delftia sp.]|nr:hypothetical protein [Delftia sp.]
DNLEFVLKGPFDLPQELVEAYRLRNDQSYTLGLSFTLKQPYKLMPQSEYDGAYNRKAMASTTRATALVLDALVQVRPASPLLPKAALWLMNERNGSHWRTTQETSYAILALADYVQVSGELAADYDFEIYLNASLLYSGSIGTANALELMPEIIVLLDALVDGANHVRIVKNGTGKLYYALTLRVSHLSDGFVAVQPSGSGISVTRSF